MDKLSREAIIEEADSRWTDLGSVSGYALSGGFIDGAEWRFDNLNVDAVEASLERFPTGEDPTEELVHARYRRGFQLGATWVDELEAAEKAKTLAEPLSLYAFFIFDPSLEGVEAKTVIGRDLDALKVEVELEVAQINSGLDSDEAIEYAWMGLIYGPGVPGAYGTYGWARAYEVFENSVFSFSEFN